MSNDKNVPEENPGNIQIRSDLVDTAVNFLLNASVIDKPYGHKTAFLKKKGLTDSEISLAYERAEKDPKYKEFLRRDVVAVNQPLLPPPVPAYGRSITFWSNLSRVSSSFIILGVALFGVHYIYKHYIEPLIYGQDPNKPKCIEEQLLDVTVSLSAIEDHIATLEEQIKGQKQQLELFLQTEKTELYPTSMAIRELKTEVTNIKSLLVSRHQFPALPKVSPLSIPEWQLPPQETNPSKPNGEVKENEDAQTPEKLSPSDESFSILPNGASEESSIKSDTENESLAT